MAEPIDDPNAGPDLTTRHVRRARAGDTASLAWLIERFTPLLVAQARYRIGPGLTGRIDPEDVVQDVWATTLPRLGDLALRDGRTTPVLLRYLSTTLLNRINNLLRKRANRASKGTDSDLLRLEEPGDGPLTRALGGERSRLVLAAIDELSERDREIVILRGIEQLRNDETSALLGIKPDAAAQAYRRALARLRERLPDSIFDLFE